MIAVPARLHALFARDSSAAVVIRRGPSRHVAVVGWDRKTDRFEVGQWLYGRIYERRCDLSPDGKHLIYFAMNGRWDSKTKGAWTAVSKAPYLKALTLLAKGDCWHGGGLFLSSMEYWLNDGSGHELLHDDSKLKRSLEHRRRGAYGGECPGVYYLRLQRDGWTVKHTAPAGKGGTVTLFEKRVSEHWTLRKRAYATLDRRIGRGCYVDEHELWNSRTEVRLEFPNWEWAESDRGRLVWAEGGMLFAGRLAPKELASTRQLHDFNALRFEKLVAPY